MKRMSWADAATGVLAVCAVIVTGLLIHREFAPPAARAAEPLVRSVRKWRPIAAGGHRVGRVDASVTIVEFADFQCPFCRESARQVGALVDSLHGSVARVYRHFPLTSLHPHAMMAAVAAECAAEQGKFDAYHDKLFASQDSIGKRSWTAFAVDAGLLDTAAFEACTRDSATVMPRIQADMKAGADLGVTGTPVLLVNDQLFSGAPTAEQLRDLVDRALKER